MTVPVRGVVHRFLHTTQRSSQGDRAARLTLGAENWYQMRPTRRFLTTGIVLLALAIASGFPSYFLDCSSPGLFVCGPMSLMAFQSRDSLAIVGIVSIAVSVGLRYRVGKQAANPPSRSATGTSYDGPTRPRQFVRAHAFILCPLLAAALCFGLVLVPVPQPFIMLNTAVYDLEPCGGIYTEAGTVVSVQWSAPSNTTLLILSCSSDWYTSQSGTSGSGSFVSSGGLYEFGASCPSGPCVLANVQGRYIGPILPMG